MRPIHLFCLLAAALLGGCASVEVVPSRRPVALQRAAALHWTIATVEGRFLGSATAIGSGRLLTNRHVVAAARGVAMVARQGTTVFAVGRQHVSGSEDLAMLEVAGVEAAPLRLRTDPPASGEWLGVAGAAAGVAEQRDGEAIAGAAAARFSAGRRVARLPVLPGFSGGPVVDEDGLLVGVVVAAAAASMEDAISLSAMRHRGPLVRRIALLIPPQAIMTALAAFGVPEALQPR